MSAATNKEIIQKINAAFEQNNPEVFLEQCSDDVKWTMEGDATYNGKQGIRDFMAAAGEMKIEKLTINKIIAEEDSAAAFGEMTMDEKGTRTNYSYCDVYTFAGDKITELRSFVVKQKSEGEQDKAASA